MHIGIFGAGSIGAYVGVRLSAMGTRVTMVGRQALVDQTSTVVAYDLKHRPHRPGPSLEITTDPEALAPCDACIVAVKSKDTQTAAETLDPVLRSNTLLISLQNGLHNAQRLRELMPPRRVSAGMVAFNVLRDGSEVFRQATKGAIVTGPAGVEMEKLAGLASEAGLLWLVRSDVDAVIAGKLLLNLNNGVCAVTGSSIAESLHSARLRYCFAQLMLEGLSVMKRAGIRPASAVGLPPWLVPRLVGLPNWIVLRVARSLVAVDPQARSSTLQDLDAGKPTEIDQLCGEIVELARRTGGHAPINAMVVDHVHTLEQSAPPLPFWTAVEFHRRVKALAAISGSRSSHFTRSE